MLYTNQPGAMRARASLFAMMFALAATLSAGARAEPLDTSRLPRVAGAKEMFASAPTTMFTASTAVGPTADAITSALTAAGWRRYVAPFTQTTENPNLRIMSMKKGPLALNVFITLAPAQGNATSVSYTAIALPNDLPIPADATDIEFDPNRPYLKFVTADSVGATLDFFRGGLTPLGWSLWSTKANAKEPDGANPGELTESGGYAAYVREAGDPVLLLLTKSADGKLGVEFKTIDPDLLAAMGRHAPPAPVQTAQISPPTAASAAPAPVIAPPKPAAPAARVASNRPLAELEGSLAPIPVPDTAENIAFNHNEDGKLVYTSVSSVAATAAFHQAFMKQRGWKLAQGVSRDDVANFDMAKGAKTISFAIKRAGDITNVSADISAMVARAEPVAQTAPAATAAEPKDGAEPLVAEMSNGLPVPTSHTQTDGAQTPFRRELTASVPSDLSAVLAFYRAELGKTGWKEDGKASVVSAESATLSFTSPEGPGRLTLGRASDETSVTLAIKNPDAAAKAGVVPPAGKAKVLLGNMLGADAAVTVNGQAIKVAAGAGKKGPGDGPSLDLAPGKYPFTIKLPGKPPMRDELTIGADETWGLMIGPGGALPVHLY